MRTKVHTEGTLLRRMPDYHVESSPNSSALFGITMLANREDILAAVRTALLLGKTFNAAVSVDFFGQEVIHVESNEKISEAALLVLLASIQDKIRETAQLALEATWTNASFISAGLLSLSVHDTESNSQSPASAR
jgi:hypothetical protein